MDGTLISGIAISDLVCGGSQPQVGGSDDRQKTNLFRHGLCPRRESLTLYALRPFDWLILEKRLVRLPHNSGDCNPEKLSARRILDYDNSSCL